MSATNRACYFHADLERWSNCDGHWWCLCSLPENSTPLARVADWLRRKLYARRHRLPWLSSGRFVRIMLGLEKMIEVANG